MYAKQRSTEVFINWKASIAMLRCQIAYNRYLSLLCFTHKFTCKSIPAIDYYTILFQCNILICKNVLEKCLYFISENGLHDSQN